MVDNETSIKNSRRSLRDDIDRFLRLLGTIAKWGLRLASVAGILVEAYSIFFFFTFVAPRGTSTEYMLLPFPSIYLVTSFCATFIKQPRTVIVTAILSNGALVIVETLGVPTGCNQRQSRVGGSVTFYSIMDLSLCRAVEERQSCTRKTVRRNGKLT